MEPQSLRAEIELLRQKLKIAESSVVALARAANDLENDKEYNASLCYTFRSKIERLLALLSKARLYVTDADLLKSIDAALSNPV